MSRTPSFPNYTWGSLFRSFYGDPDWKDFLTETLKEGLPTVNDDYTFADGTMLEARVMNTSISGSASYEFRALLHSESIFMWSKKCGLLPNSSFSEINNFHKYSRNVFTEVNVKSVGCRFTLDDIRASYLNETGRVPDNETLEHSWSLSNSCGVFVNPSNTERFKKLVFGGESATDKISEVSNTVSEYLSHCLTLVDKYKNDALSGQRKMFSFFVNKIIEHLSSTDLQYSTETDNALLTGIIYDYILAHDAYEGDYASNVAHFRIFLERFLPFIEDTFKFVWVRTPKDFRLLFKFDIADLVKDKLNFSNINDSIVILGPHLKRLENVMSEDVLNSIQDRIAVILESANPNLDGGVLWAAFFCYYGTYRTGMTRVVPRPRLYKPPPQLTSLVVDMGGVEDMFNDVQSKNMNINVRRQFCGLNGGLAINCYKAYGIRFPTVCNLAIPDELGYLNVDFYKRIPNGDLSDEERLILCNVNRSVDEMCVNRMVQISKGTAQRPLKSSLKHTSSTKHTLDNGDGGTLQRLSTSINAGRRRHFVSSQRRNRKPASKN
ncbi:p62 protein [Thesium chinense closterovirus 1]|nr:p62 protein [Thesium chinense closterovirus 1]